MLHRKQVENEANRIDADLNKVWHRINVLMLAMEKRGDDVFEVLNAARDVRKASAKIRNLMADKDRAETVW